MRIYIKIKHGPRFIIPAPIGLVKATIGFCSFGISISQKSIPKEKLQYIESVNFKELKKNIDVLKDYKGLTLVDVKTEDGTAITIIV
ncbi:hypothetical protein [Clostridium psychrophilum]|uniref:hypothetical protein n=1 Tax=Clostridium psychrophilum TaxID=132926 RepID=UPI001C0C438F|nr:hypothetical protein [Clostridium psychrophilum]MBU3182037.1 hypothetical protein [Clostridium psychrophilum]